MIPFGMNHSYEFLFGFIFGHSRSSPFAILMGTRSRPRFLGANSFQIHCRLGLSRPTNDTTDSGVDVRQEGTLRSIVAAGGGQTNCDPPT
jgi:hypothetical protein